MVDLSLIEIDKESKNERRYQGRKMKFYKLKQSSNGQREKDKSRILNNI